MRKKNKYLLFLILTGGIFLMGEGLSEAQWLEGYSYRTRLNVGGDPGSLIDPPTNFPLLFSHTDPMFRSVSHGGQIFYEDGRDFCFTDKNTQYILPFEIESYDPLTGSITAWINTLETDTSGELEMIAYFSNPGAVPEWQPQEVWSNHYTTVWHMNTNPQEHPHQYPDVTSYMNHGTSPGIATAGSLVNGKISGGVWFDGIDDYARMPANGFNTAAGTVELWIRVDSLPVINSDYIFAHRNPNPISQRVYVRVWSGGTWGTGMGNTYDLVRGSVVDTARWYHMALTWDGSEVTGYLNGTRDFGPVPYMELDTVSEIYIMTWMPGSESMKGTLDELRLSNVARDSAWIAAAYANQSQPDQFVEVGIFEEWSQLCPVAFSVNGGGEYSQRDTGVMVNLTGSEPGVEYTLVLNEQVRMDTLSGSGNPLTWGPLSDSGVYRVEAESLSNGCIASMADSAVVTLISETEIFTVSGGGSFCLGDTGVSVRLSGSAPGTLYTMVLNDTIRLDTLAGNGEGLIWYHLQEEGTYSVMAVTPEDTMTTWMTGSAEITGLLPPGLSYTAQSISCFGEGDGSISLNIQTDQPYSVDWIGPDGFQSNSELLTGLSPGGYQVVITDSSQCVSSSSLIWISEPELLAAKVIQVNHLTSYQLNDGTVDLNITGGTPPYQVTWTGTDGYLSHAQYPDSMTVGYYEVLVTDLHGCGDSIQGIKVALASGDDGLFIPEGFSPNGDGYNDRFVILGIESYPENQLIILNRQGVKLLDRINYQNDWDGTPENGGVFGGQLREGTYYYIFRYGLENIRKGFVYINRE